MKLTLIGILICFMQVSATVYSQATKFSFELKEKQVVDVLREIEDNSNFRFFYQREQVDVERKVNINVNQNTVEEILDALFNSEDIKYKVLENDLIILTPDKVNYSNNLSSADQGSVAGTVKDERGVALPGVTVLVKGTTQGTVTDMNGNYSISALPNDAVLVFSFIGMLTQEVKVDGNNTIDVTLSVDAIGIEEVVAIGYGTQKKVNLTGSVSSISSDELTKRPVSNVAQMMQGKLAGVSIFSDTGQPGNEGTSINIRGLNSFGTNNNPIVLVDGVEGNLSDLDPDNIESISVLKDASSAAIYGSRAANGVVLVTTKTGKAGVFSVQYHGNFGVHTPTRLPDLVNDPVEYMNMFNIAAENSGLGNRYPADIIQKYQSGELKGFNWDDAVFKNPFVHKHNLTVTGGGDKVRFNFAAGFWEQEGVVIGNAYKRYNARFNIEADINKYISFGANIGAVHGKREDTNWGAVDLMLSTYAALPTYAATLDDGRPVGGAFDFEQHNKNPVTSAERGGRWDNSYNVNGKAYLRVKPAKGLTWETTGAIKYDHTYYKQQAPAVQEFNYITGEPMGYMNGQGNIELWIRQPFETLYTLFSTLNYETSFNDVHNIQVLGGYSQESFKHDYLNGYRKGIPIEALMEINAGSVDGQTVNGSSYEWALQSFFGRLNYDYKGKYLAEVNFRYDGSSRFQKDNRWGFFPSFSAGWRVSEEDFAKDIEWLSNLKIRASWGELGNQLIGNYPYQSVLALGYGYPWGSAITSGAVQTGLANENISWETTKITDIGLDLDIANGLFSLTFDYFNKTTTDILRGAQVMGHVGLSAPTINDGEMKNTGFDFVASHRKTLGDFAYNVDLTFSKFKNELTKYGAQSIGGQTIRREGEPLDSWYMLEFDGIFQSEQEIANSPTHFYTPTPGDIKLKDKDGDGDVDQDDRVIMDGKYPSFSYGANINLSWKNFDLTAFFQGVEGAKNYVTMWGTEPFIQGSRPPVKWRNAWSPTNPTNELPKLYFGFSDTNNRQTSSFYLQDASYLRLKNIQLGFNVPKSLLGDKGIKALRFYVSGDNLLTFTNYEGADPERGETGWRNFANYPQVKIYSAGVKIKF